MSNPAAYQPAIGSPVKLLLIFRFFFHTCFASKLFVYETQVLRFGDYPQGSAGLRMKAYSSASHSTVIFAIGLESLVNTKQERGSVSAFHLVFFNSSILPHPLSSPTVRLAQYILLRLAGPHHQLHLGLIVHSETPPRVWVRPSPLDSRRNLQLTKPPC